MQENPSLSHTSSKRFPKVVPWKFLAVPSLVDRFASGRSFQSNAKKLFSIDIRASRMRWYRTNRLSTTNSSVVQPSFTSSAIYCKTAATIRCYEMCIRCLSDRILVTYWTKVRNSCYWLSFNLPFQSFFIASFCKFSLLFCKRAHADFHTQCSRLHAKGLCTEGRYSSFRCEGANEAITAYASNLTTSSCKPTVRVC